MVGYAGVTTALNSALMLSPTESPMNRNDPTGAASNGALTTLVVSNHGAGISNVVLNVHPETVTLPAVPLMVTLVAYPFRPWDRPNEPVWSSTVSVDARSVLQVNNVPIPRSLTNPQENRRIGSMSVWLTVTSDQPYLGYVSSVFEGGESGSLPFQVFALRGQAATPGPQ